MTLSRAEVEHIAELAKLALNEDEKARYGEQLSAILEYAASLQALDMAHIPPTASVLPLESVMRDDVARPSLTLEDVLANAPDQANGQFRVRAILE